MATRRKPKYLFVAGHRPRHLSTEQRRNARDAAARLIDYAAVNGFTHLLTGAAPGPEMWAAGEAVLDDRMKLEIVGSAMDEMLAARWSVADLAMYGALTRQATKVSYASTRMRIPESFVKRDRAAIGRAGACAFFWNGARTGGVWEAMQTAIELGRPCYVVTVQDGRCGFFADADDLRAVLFPADETVAA